MPRINLDLIEVPSPCTVPWDTMSGDDRVRHCVQCRQNVYHLSNLSQQEAEDLIRANEGELCVQFYRRPAGSVVTRDCAVVRWWRGLTSGLTIAIMFPLTLFGLSFVMRSAPANSTFSFVGGGICPPRGSFGGASAAPVQPSAETHADQPAQAPAPRAKSEPSGSR